MRSDTALGADADGVDVTRHLQEAEDRKTDTRNQLNDYQLQAKHRLDFSYIILKYYPVKENRQNIVMYKTKSPLTEANEL